MLVVAPAGSIVIGTSSRRHRGGAATAPVTQSVFEEIE